MRRWRPGSAPSPGGAQDRTGSRPIPRRTPRRSRSCRRGSRSRWSARSPSCTRRSGYPSGTPGATPGAVPYPDRPTPRSPRPPPRSTGPRRRRRCRCCSGSARCHRCCWSRPAPRCRGTGTAEADSKSVLTPSRAGAGPALAQENANATLLGEKGAVGISETTKVRVAPGSISTGVLGPPVRALLCGSVVWYENVRRNLRRPSDRARGRRR